MGLTKEPTNELKKVIVDVDALQRISKKPNENDIFRIKYTTYKQKTNFEKINKGFNQNPQNTNMFIYKID